MGKGALTAASIVCAIGLLALVTACNEREDRAGRHSEEPSERYTTSPSASRSPSVAAPTADLADRQRDADEALKRARQADCQRLATEPNAVLLASDISYAKATEDDGVESRMLVSVTILNKSKTCALASAEGDLTWLDAQGKPRGSVPFTVKKSIPAGATETVSQSNGTLEAPTHIQGPVATDYRVTFREVRVLQ